MTCNLHANDLPTYLHLNTCLLGAKNQPVAHGNRKRLNESTSRPRNFCSPTALKWLNQPSQMVPGPSPHTPTSSGASATQPTRTTQR